MEEDYLENNNTENIFTRNNEEAKRDYFIIARLSKTENEKIKNREERDNDVDFIHAKLGALEDENNRNEGDKNNENPIDNENNEKEMKEKNQNNEKNEEFQEPFIPKYEEKIKNKNHFIIVSFIEKLNKDRINLRIRYKNCKNITKEIFRKSIDDYQKRKRLNDEFEIDFCLIKKVKK